MPLESALLGYAALANLALANPRHRPATPMRTALPPGASRTLGGMLLILSAWLAALHFGPYQGTVAWLGLFSLAGLVLILLKSRWPRAALALWLPSLAAGLGLAVVG